MSNKTTIEIRENGPLIVKHLDNFKMPDDTTLEKKSVYALCRCGASKNKPYCDGSHSKINFDGNTNDVSHRDRIYSYEGNETNVHVYFNKLLCSHSGECGKHALAIFNPKQKPWVQPDQGPLEQIKEVVAACPSGALRYSTNEEPQAITTDDVCIEIERNGPYRVTNIPIEADYWADGQTEKKYVLCRCGMSQNKPFCDGTHYEEKWRDDT